jgi:hypothetical protein
MIRDDSAMDRPVSGSEARRKKLLIRGAIALLLLALIDLPPVFVPPIMLRIRPYDPSTR